MLEKQLPIVGKNMEKRIVKSSSTRLARLIQNDAATRKSD
jgi:hypothetical protein